MWFFSLFRWKIRSNSGIFLARSSFMMLKNNRKKLSTALFSFEKRKREKERGRERKREKYPEGRRQKPRHAKVDVPLSRTRKSWSSLRSFLPLPLLFLFLSLNTANGLILRCSFQPVIFAARLIKTATWSATSKNEFEGRLPVNLHRAYFTNIASLCLSATILSRILFNHLVSKCLHYPS